MDIDLSDTQELNIDFAGIRYFNSVGIKLWVNFTEVLNSNPKLKIFFHNCNHMVVDQTNKTLGFINDNTTIASVKLPIFCTKCEKTIEIFHDMSQGVPDESELFQNMNGDECGGNNCKKNWEADYIPKDFFKFLNKHDHH